MLITTLFPRGHERYEASPVAADLEAFASWLGAAGYSREKTRDHVCRLKQALARLRPQSPHATFTEAQLQAAFRSRSCRPHYRATQRAFARFLRQVGRLSVPSSRDPLTMLRVDYLQSLSERRGLALATIQQHDSTLKDFLSRGLSSQRSLAGLRAEDIERYVHRRSQEVTRDTVQHVVAHLRAFLRYGHAQGTIPQPLDVIDTPRTYRGERLPRALAWPLVLKLLASVDRRSRAGWRDAAILHLMACYGLRPSEIISLTLTSIDWRAKTLQVEQRKTRSLLTVPLMDPTVSILQRYLRQGRPVSEHPQLFLRARAPVGALTHSGVGDLFQKRASLSGLPLDGVSSYGLRHAFAMRLLRQGVGVKAIGDLLGHRSIESTAIYLRLHTDMLRGVALPVPRVSGRRCA